MIEIRATIEGDVRVREAIIALAESMNASMKKKLLDKVGNIYLKHTLKRFDTQTDPKGRTWKHNTKTTQKYKVKGLPGRGPAINGPNFRGVWTGNLINSLKFRIEGDDVVIGSNQVYARTFNDGRIGSYPTPWGTIPPRPFLGVTKLANDEIMEMFNRFFSTDIFK